MLCQKKIQIQCKYYIFLTQKNQQCFIINYKYFMEVVKPDIFTLNKVRYRIQLALTVIVKYIFIAECNNDAYSANT